MPSREDVDVHQGSHFDHHGAWPETFQITRPKAIELLASRRILRVLNPFMSNEHTLTTASAALGRSPSSVAYWLPTLVREGLLVHLRNETRAGRSMPVYRSPGRRLTVPFGLIPFDQRVSLLDSGRLRMLHQFLDGLDEVMASAGDVALEFAPHGDGASIQLLETAGQTTLRQFTDAWLTMKLTEADALAFSGELEALVERYADRNGPREYVVHVGIAPTPKRPWRSVSDPS